MKIAVASQNFRTVTSHAGRARRFLVYELDTTGEPMEVDRVDLPMGMAIHDWHEAGAHPLDAVSVVIAASCGEGFVRRMAARGIAAIATEQSNPVEAVKAYLAACDVLSDGVPAAAGGCHGGDHHGDPHQQHHHEEPAAAVVGEGCCHGGHHNHGHQHHHQHRPAQIVEPTREGEGSL